MADKVEKPSFVEINNIGHIIDEMTRSASEGKRKFEKRWYDNNFFDDGQHFRYVSRVTGKIVNPSDSGNLNIPQRAIPKARKQIRAISNLLLKPDYTPVVVPEKVLKNSFPDPNQYLQVYTQNKERAKKVGQWVQRKWVDFSMKERLTLMTILSAKNYISYLQIWPDAVKEEIRVDVFDAFEIDLSNPALKDIEDSTFVIKKAPKTIEEIKANEAFDPAQREKISPDNKYASSELKEAYMKGRYGTQRDTERNESVILKEAFIKVYLSEKNIEEIMSKAGDILKGKKMGDVIMRHAFCAGGVYLLDEYLDLQEYPFVDFRYEPGAIYGTSLIEDFMPANKSLDIIASRVEGWINTMVVGIWLKQKGANFKINNLPGGQEIEYEGVPPTQAKIENLPPSVFQFMEFLSEIIGEQGPSVSAFGNTPPGVKSGVAIESLKATEFDNLTIAYDQLKKTVERIANKMVKIKSNFVGIESTSVKNNGEFDFLETTGEQGIRARQELGEDTSSLTSVKESDKVEIEVQQGLGFTAEGKKQTMQQIIEFMMQLSQMGVMTVDSVKVLAQKFFEVYGFGATQDFLDALDSGNQTMPLNEDQIAQLKIAVVEAMKDTGMVGNEMQQSLVDSTKVGMMETIKDLSKGGTNGSPTSVS